MLLALRAPVGPENKGKGLSDNYRLIVVGIAPVGISAPYQDWHGAVQSTQIGRGATQSQNPCEGSIPPDLLAAQHRRVGGGGGRLDLLGRISVFF